MPKKIAILVICLLITACSSAAKRNFTAFKTDYQADKAVTIGVIGDSTSCGYGANPGPITWTNGISYGYLQPNDSWGPNWTNDYSGKFLYSTIDATSRITTAKSRSNAIPGVMQLLRAHLKSKNADSELWNYAARGEKSLDALEYGRVAALASLTPKPNAVVISLGINDAKFGNEYSHFSSWAANMRTLVSQCIATGMSPILVKQHNIAYWDFSKALSPPQWKVMENWETWAAEIDVIAAESELEVIDLYSITNPFDIRLMYDPFHPNAAGYELFFNAFRDKLGR